MSVTQSAEPTMEEILASIRKIISDENDGSLATEPAPQPAAVESEARQAAEMTDRTRPTSAAAEEILELDSPVEEAAPKEESRSSLYELSDDSTDAITGETLISADAARKATQRMSELSGLLVRNYPGAENTLDGLVRDMLRPMLKEWLDANLPTIVDKIVEAEIARISGRAR